MKPTNKRQQAGIPAGMILTVMILVLTISAAAPLSTDPLQHLPEGALAVFSIGNPTRLAVNTMAFIRAAGLDSLYRPMNALLDYLNGQHSGKAAFNAALANVDWNRRMVAAFYPAPPTASGQARIGLALLVPVWNVNDAATAISSAAVAADQRWTVYTHLPGYVVAVSGLAAPAGTNYPRANLTRLSAYPAASLAVWLDVNQSRDHLEVLARNLGAAWSEATGTPGTPADTVLGDYLRQALGLSPGPTPGSSGLGTAASRAIGLPVALSSRVNGSTALEVGVLVDANRVWFRLGSSVAPGSTLHAASVRAATGTMSIPYLAYCESDALVSAAWSAGSAWVNDALGLLQSTMLPGNALAGQMLATMRAWTTAAESDGAMSMRLSQESTRVIREGSRSDPDLLALLTSALPYSFSATLQAADRQQFRDALAANMDLMRTSAYRTLLADSGLDLTVSRTVGRIDGQPFDSYQYGLAAPDASSPAAKTANELRNLLGPLLNPVYVYRDDKAYLSLGNPVRAETPIGQEKNRRPLATDQAFKALRGRTPPDTKALIYLSTSRIIRLAMQATVQENRILPFGFTALQGLLLWFNAQPGYMGTGIGLGAEDIRALRSLLD